MIRERGPLASRDFGGKGRLRDVELEAREDDARGALERGRDRDRRTCERLPTALRPRRARHPARGARRPRARRGDALAGAHGPCCPCARRPDRVGRRRALASHAAGRRASVRTWTRSSRTAFSSACGSRTARRTSSSSPDADLDPPRPSAAALLSPFDNLLWDRPFARRVLRFDHLIEVYKPAPQRQFGYYVLPVPLARSHRRSGRPQVRARRGDPRREGAPSRAAVSDTRPRSTTRSTVRSTGCAGPIGLEHVRR